jgi:ribokinase
MSRVVIVGSINVDETLPVSAWPQPGETVLLSGPVRSGLGGKGANQAVAAALAGAEVAFVGAVGEDAGATLALESLRSRGVGLDAVRRVAGATTGRATILLHTDGENLILVDPGANAAVCVADVEAARETLAAADVVLVQGEVAPEVVDATARVCRETGTRFVLNLAPPVDVAVETLAAADPLVVNELEARSLGIDPDAPALAGAVTLVVTRGGAGVTVVTAEATTSVPSLAVAVVDTTGAGDAFAGTLCAALAAGAELVAAAHAGSAAGAYAVTRPGASASYGTADEVAGFAASR